MKGVVVELNQNSLAQSIEDPSITWDITLRDARKHKKYPKFPSEMKGISNRNNGKYESIQSAISFRLSMDSKRMGCSIKC